MSKYARRYPPEFKAEAVRLAQQGEKSIQQIADDLGVADQTLRNWIRQATPQPDLVHRNFTAKIRAH